MRVRGPSSSSSAAPSRRAGAKPASGFSAVEPSEEARANAGISSAAGAAPAASVGSLEALLALQAVAPDADAAGRAAHRAGGLLDVLDGLKLALLEGGPLTGRLSALSALASSAREATGDPRLESILDEVETRAAVELAKHAAA